MDLGVIVHVTREQKFIDGPYWYRYAEHEAARGKDIQVCFIKVKFLKGESTWHSVLPHLDGKSVHGLSSDPTLSTHTDFHKKTNESDIPPLLFDHHNCDLFDQVRPIHWVDPKAEVIFSISLNLCRTLTICWSLELVQVD